MVEIICGIVVGALILGGCIYCLVSYINKGSRKTEEESSQEEVKPDSQEAVQTKKKSSKKA